MPKTDVNQALKCENGGLTGGGGWLVARLAVVGGVGYGGCKPRIEGIVKCT